MSKKGKSKIIGLIFIVALGAGGFFIYQKYIAGAIHLKDKNYTYVYVETNDTFEDVINDINADNIIDDLKAFEFLLQPKTAEIIKIPIIFFI